MLFKEALNTPCGLRYMYDSLDLRSSAGRRLLLETEMMTDGPEISEHYGKLMEFFEKADDKNAATLQVKLTRLRDIAGTASGLASGTVLDDVELFEVKNLLLLAIEIREVLSAMKVGSVTVSLLCEIVVRILDPDGQRVPSFHVYDSYSDELARLRAEIKRKGEDEELLRRSQELENAVRVRLSGELRQYANVIWLTLETLAEVDVLLAQSMQMKDMGLVFPQGMAELSGTASSGRGKTKSANKSSAVAAAEYTDEMPSHRGRTKYVKMFHPQVRELLAEKGRDFQPVDIDFGGGPVTIIGANMGGKTVVLKTVGLCQLLFQFGFGIPADEAVIDIKRGVLFCIGEQENIMEKGLSSFASEVVCINGIIEAAGKGGRMLALVDEPARATNPVEGTALVEAFIRIMDGGNTDLIVTTHYKLEGTPGRKFRVTGLVGGKMDYSLVETDDSAIPHEAVNIAQALGADARWLALTKEILEKKAKRG